jgi:4-hydroxybenzoate polyprenyltransferase
MIALLSAMVILVLWLFEFFALKNDPLRFVDVMKQIPVLQLIVAGYALFAFSVSLIREIVKDAEDRQGDMEGGYRTFAVVHGVIPARRLAIVLHLFTMVLLAAGMYLLYREKLMLVFWYLVIAVMLLFMIILYHLLSAREKKDFQFLSNGYKLIMLAGILSMQLFYISY